MQLPHLARRFLLALLPVALAAPLLVGATVSAGLSRLPDGDAAVPREQLEAQLGSVHRHVWIASLGAGVATALLLLLLLGQLCRRLRALRDTMDAVAAGELHRRLPVQGEDELAQLARTFNRMVADLHTSQEALREQSRRLSEALAEVEDVEGMKDSFLSLVSHEVRTPLTSIMGGVEFLRDPSFGERDETEAEFLGIIYQSCQRLHGFMNDAMLMAQLQTNRGREGFEEFSLTALLHAKLRELDGEIEREGLELDDRVRGGGEVLLEGDWTLMAVALGKILHNAVRHNRPGGRIELELVDDILEAQRSCQELQVSRGVSLPGPGLEWKALRVFNTGPVIPPGRRPALFDRFSLAYDIQNHQRGSGLSLPIAAWVMDHHRGHIELTDVGGEGMAFYLLLPVRQLEAPAELPDAPGAGLDATVAAGRLVQARARANQLPAGPEPVSTP